MQIISIKLIQLENEGRLATRMRATLVRQEALGKIANDLKLSQSLILSTGELKSGGHDRESILADTVESIIGAIYVDCSDLTVLEPICVKMVRAISRPYRANRST